MTLLNGDVIPPLGAGMTDGDMRALDFRHPPPAGPIATCRTAPKRGTVRRTDFAEVWEDIGPASTLSVHSATSTGNFTSPATWANRAGGWSVTFRWAAGDWDNDGDQDLVAVWSNGGLNSLSIWRTTVDANGARSFVQLPNPRTARTWLAQTQWLPGDYDNDGLVDLMSVSPSGGLTRFTFWKSTGTAFAAPVDWITQGGWNVNIKWSVADFNNDGRDDILANWPEGTGTTFTVWRPTGLTSPRLVQSPWLSQYGGWANTMQFLPGDYDVDGDADVMVVWNEAGFATFSFHANQGSTFGPAENWLARDGVWADNIKWRAGDFDGDGRADVAAAWNEAGRTTLTVRRNNPFSGTRLLHEVWKTRTAGWQDSAVWCAGAFDGT